MNILKIINYLFSLAHVGLQLFYFTKWQACITNMGKMASNLDPVTMGNANLGLNQESYIYLSLALLTLSVYLSVSQHLNQFILEKAIAGDTGGISKEKEGE